MPGTYNSTGISKINRKILAADPASPSAGFFMDYPKSDGFYFKDNAGAVQKFATSAGGMADAVILAPGSSARNVMQPTADAVPLTAKRFSSGATSDLFRAQDETGADLFRVASNGDINRQGAAGTNRSVFFRTGTSVRWEILTNNSAESGSNAGSDFTIKRYSDAGGLINEVVSIIRATGQTWFHHYDGGTNDVVTSLFVRRNSTNIPAASFGHGILFALHSSTTIDRSAGRLRYAWTTATDASRTSRGTLSAYDTAERDCIAWEASGSASMVAFHGAAPIVRPANANEAAVAGTAATQTTPWGFSTQAQADGIVTLVNAIRQCLVDYNLWKGAA